MAFEKAKRSIKKLAIGLCAASFLAGAASCTLVGNALMHDKSKPYVAERNHKIKYSNLGTLKVVTYNIAHCRGYKNMDELSELGRDMSISSKEQVYRCLDNIAEFLMQEDADIAGLNEVDRNTAWGYGINYAEYLAQKAGYNYYAFGTKWDYAFPFLWGRANDTIFPLLKVHMGNAVLSKYPIVSARNNDLNRENSLLDWAIGETRYLSVLINVQGQEIRFISTHLDEDYTDPSFDRPAQIKSLVEKMKNRKRPIILTGDLNAIIPNERYPDRKDLLEGLIDSGEFNVFMKDINPDDKSYFTSNTENPHQTIDYILVTNDIEIKSYYVPQVKYSDHFPVAAEIKIKE